MWNLVIGNNILDNQVLIDVHVVDGCLDQGCARFQAAALGRGMCQTQLISTAPPCQWHRTQCSRVGAEVARPASPLMFSVSIWRVMMSRVTCLVKKSAGLSVPSTLVSLKSPHFTWS